MLCLDGKVRRPKIERVPPEELKIGDYLPGYGGTVWRVEAIRPTRSGGCHHLIRRLGANWSYSAYPRAPQRRFVGWKDNDPAN